MTLSLRCCTRLVSAFRGMLFASAAMLLSIPAAAHAQAAPATATRTSDITVYGGYLFSQPDYGLAGRNNNGFVVGGAFTHYFHLFHREFGSGLDVRFDRDTGETVNERAYTGSGLIRTTFLRRYHLYGTAGLGSGVIAYNYVPSTATYRGDNGWILAGGGGVDVDITRRWAVRADYQLQHWTEGINEHIDPSLFGFSVVYTIPFKPWISHGHEND